MKTNFFLLCLLCLCISVHSKAQQLQTASIKTAQDNAVYTYKVFQAPNKLYGYDIFRNGKGIFHQTVKTKTSDTSALNTNEKAQKAAMLSIQKMKNKTNPALSLQEIKKITAQ